MSHWYAHIGGKQYGPVAIEELRDWMQQDRVAPSDLVWREGMADWTPAGKVPELSGGASPQPGQPPLPGQPGPGGYSQPAVAYAEPHRGGTVLTFGILGLLCCFLFGIAAWSMGNTDMRKMDAGTMDPAGRAMTQAGKIIGLIATILALVGLAINIIALLATGSTFWATGM